MEKRVQKLSCVVLFTFAVLLLATSRVGAYTCEIIRIENEKAGGGTKIMLYPEKITVPAGSCTVWINWVTKGEITVSFRENARKCEASSESPSGFNFNNLKDGEACYMSEKLPRGKTASLVWKEPGIYKYTIEQVEPVAGKDSLYGRVPVGTGIIEVK